MDEEDHLWIALLIRMYREVLICIFSKKIEGDEALFRQIHGQCLLRDFPTSPSAQRRGTQWRDGFHVGQVHLLQVFPGQVVKCPGHLARGKWTKIFTSLWIKLMGSHGQRKIAFGN